MQDKVTYEYAIIRLVPVVERGEFLNIGVILFSKRKKFLDMKYQLDENRIKAFSKDIDIPTIEAYLKGWELVCQGNPEGGRIGESEIQVRFRWLTATRSTIIQSSKVHPGLCHDPQKILDDLFVKYVL